jgi:hypothetical protein
LFSFTLSSAQMAALDALDVGDQFAVDSGERVEF